MATTSEQRRLSARITETELLEYRGRLAVYEHHRRAFDAAALYLREYQMRLREAYTLPDQYEIHLETGEIYWSPTAMEERYSRG